MKYFGWIAFFLFVIGLAVGGYILVKDISYEPFKYKDVEEVNYSDELKIEDFVASKLKCSNGKCTFKKKDFLYKFSKVTKLGKQDITLDVDYDNEKYSKVFKVLVKDLEKPSIILKEESVSIKLNESFDPKSYIKEVKDNYDKLEIKDVKIDSSVNLKKEGTYEVKYTLKDSANNENTVILEVIVSKSTSSSSKEVTSSNKNDKKTSDKSKVTKTTPKSTTTKPKIDVKTNGTKGTATSNFTWELSTSGIHYLDHTFNSSKKTQSSSGTVLFKTFVDNDIIFKSKLTGSGNYEVTTIYNTIEGIELKDTSKINGFQFEFNITALPYDSKIIIKIKDLKLNQEFTETINLKATYPKYLSDVYIINEEKDGYEYINYALLGDFDTYYFDYYLIDSNDPYALDEDVPLEDFLIEGENCLKLKYNKGFWYEIGLEFEYNGVTKTKHVKIAK